MYCELSINYACNKVKSVSFPLCKLSVYICIYLIQVGASLTSTQQFNIHLGPSYNVIIVVTKGKLTR